MVKFGKYYFGWLDLSSDFFGHSEQSAWVSQRHSSEITVQPNLFSFLEIFKAQKFGMGFSAPLDHPCHLNLECFPWECTHAQSCYTAKYTCSYPALRLWCIYVFLTYLGSSLSNYITYKKSICFLYFKKQGWKLILLGCKCYSAILILLMFYSKSPLGWNIITFR